MSTTIMKNRQGLSKATPDQAPYILICNEHDWAAGSESREEAKQMAEWPTEWCEDCLHAEIEQAGY
jgi:hypothetical protein